jgi:hypothetical protein
MTRFGRELLRTTTTVPPADRRRVTHAALQWKGGVFQDRLATWNQRDLADLAGLLAKLNES